MRLLVDLATDAIRGLDREFLLAEFPAGAAAERQLSLAPVTPPAPLAFSDQISNMPGQRRNRNNFV